MDSSPSNNSAKQLNRDYKCPCGKTYLSNAAIFTHIKQKHGGIAPGPIEKPKHQSKPRGRPPLLSKKQAIQQKQSQSNKPIRKSKQQISGNKVYWQAFQEIFNYLNEITYPQDINPQIWESVEGFKRMEQYIETKPNQKSFKYMGVCIGLGLSQFLKQISESQQKFPWRFEQTLILFILLLQYAIDENNSTSIIEEAPIELLIDFMNPFIKDHITDYAEYLNIDNLWIMKEANMTKIFLCFYNWLKWKDYTQYCITLI